MRALVDSASLLWRGHAAGAWDTVDVGPVLASVEPGLLADPPTPFVALHAAIALTAAGDAHGLARLRRRAAARPDPVFRETVAPLADALVHLVLAAVRCGRGELARRILHSRLDRRPSPA